MTKKKQQGERDLGEDFNNPEDEQDSPTAELSGHDVDSESHISESSDPTSDADSTPIKNEEATTDFLKDRSEGSVCITDSLEQMKAIYKSFLNNPYWSFLSLNSSQPHADEQPASSSGSSSSNSSPGRNSYDWHQSAIAKTLQQVSQKQHAALEPSIFSTVQLYRQSTKLYGSIFTGASKFHCKSCSASYDTLLDLTVHMNEQTTTVMITLKALVKVPSHGPSPVSALFWRWRERKMSRKSYAVCTVDTLLNPCKTSACTW